MHRKLRIKQKSALFCKYLRNKSSDLYEIDTSIGVAIGCRQANGNDISRLPFFSSTSSSSFLRHNLFPRSKQGKKLPERCLDNVCSIVMSHSLKTRSSYYPAIDGIYKTQVKSVQLGKTLDLNL